MLYASLSKGLIQLLVALSCWLGLASAQYASTYPSPIPLVQRSPYFGLWLPANATMNFPGDVWANAWNGRKQMWPGYVRVDGRSWQWQGTSAAPPTTTLAVYVTPTRTIFTVDAGPVRLNLTFLSPIEPSDWVLQSLPFSYLSIDAWSTDGNPHSVQLYTGITGEFVSSSDNSPVQWGTTQTTSSVFHQIKRTAALSMVENNDSAEDGIAYLATSASTPGLTWQTAASETTKHEFSVNGSMPNTQDTNFRAINDGWPVVVLVSDLGTISRTASPVVFALGLVRDPVIRYVRDGGIETRRSYFWTKYPLIDQAIDAFLADFPGAMSRAIALDNKIMTEAASISPQYADLAAVSLRQTMGSIEITASRTMAGDTEWNMTDIMVFMKDVGNSRRVNPVEIMYAAFPAFLYLNASLAGLMLDPLLEFQSSRQYGNAYAAPDLGNAFPDAMGNNTNTVSLGVDSSATMLIMALAHAQKSGEGAMMLRSYPLLRKWADYLVLNALQPNGYTTSDGLSNSMSNLAFKGIMGIYAMSKINQALEPQGMLANDTEHYMTVARNYMSDWEDLAFSVDHITSSYGNPNSWGLVYNLYASRLLNSGLIGEGYLVAQSAWYASKAQTAPAFGLPYDTNDPNTVKAHWTMFAAASLYNASTRDTLISMVHSRAFMNGSGYAMPTSYDPATGATLGTRGGRASPAYGAVFAPLALTVPNVVLTIPKESDAVDLDVAAIAGGIVGGVSAVFLIALAVWLYWRRSKKLKAAAQETLARPLVHDDDPSQSMLPMQNYNSHPGIPGVTPYAYLPAASSSNDDSTGMSKRPPLPPSTLPQHEPSSNTYTYTSKGHDASRILGPPRPSHLRDASASNSNLSATNLTADSASMYATTMNMQSPDTLLRSEVEQLRREMEDMRNERMMQQEPPPVYNEPRVSFP